MPPEKETDPARGFAEELLTPQFWQCQKEKRPLCLQGVGQGLLAKVGTDEILEALCKGTRPRLGTTFAHLRGEPHLRENVFLAYLDQATLSLNSAEHFLPWLLKACQALEAAFAFVSARLVIDPEHQKIPTSESDLLVLQLLGEEQLTVIRPLEGLPVSAPRPKPLLEVDLKPCDALFLPAGLEGRVPSVSAPRLPMVYILLTLQSKELSFSFSLCRHMGALLLAERTTSSLPRTLSAEADGFFRSAITRRTKLDLESGKQDLDEAMRRHAMELVSKVTAADLRKDFDFRVQELRQEQLEGAKEVQSMSFSDPLVLSRSLLRLARGVAVRCTPGATSAHFTRGTDTMTLNIASTASALLAALSDQQIHRVDGLPCADPIERLCVCNVLLRKGCLELAGVEAAG